MRCARSSGGSRFYLRHVARRDMRQYFLLDVAVVEYKELFAHTGFGKSYVLVAQ